MCNKDIMDSIGLSCEMSGNRVFTIIISMFGLIFSIIHEWWLSLFFQNGAQDKKDHMAGENHMFFVYFNGFRLTIGIIACVRIESYAWL